MGGMSGTNIDPNALSDPRLRGGLFRALLGAGGGDEGGESTPTTPRLADQVTTAKNNMPDPVASPNRMDDDITKHPQGQDFVEDAPGMASASRMNLAEAVRGQNQPQQPDRLAAMQSEYDQLGQKPEHSLKQKIGAVLMGLGGKGDKLQQEREFEQGQATTQRGHLLNNIEAERRLQEQEQLSTDRMTLQERMQGEREKAAQDSQGRLFTQQNQMEDTREKSRQQFETEKEAERDKTQRAQFGQQQTLMDQREDSAEKRQQAMFRQQQTLLNQRESNQKATADETRRADLGNNMQENLDQLEDIVKRRPELFGPMAGRVTGLKQMIGTSDPDVAKLKAIKEYLGMASVGAHSMRNAQHVGAAADAVMSGFLNSPKATQAAIDTARHSVGTFMQDVQQPGRAGRGVPNQNASAPAQGGTNSQPAAKLKDRATGKVLVEGKDF